MKVCRLAVLSSFWVLLTPSVRAEDVTFSDVTATAGLSGIGNCSWSFAWADFDDDGDPDMFSTGHMQQVTSSRNYFFVNNGDGTFTEMVESLGIGMISGDSHGAGWADFDRDTDLDLLIINGTLKTSGANNNLLLRNDGGIFVDIDAVAGTTYQGYRGRSANWLDLDNDGLLDIFSTGRVDANGGEGNLLLDNDGDQTFTNVSAGSGLQVPTEFNTTPSFADYNNDGALDVFLCAQGWLFAGNGDGTWTDVTAAAGFGSPTQPCASAAWIDHDNDGDQDLYVSTSVVDRVHEFWQNNGDGTFAEIGAQVGVDELFAAAGTAVGDPDNDGDLDLYVGAAADETEPNRFYRNDGDGTFTDISVAAGVEGHTPFQATDVGFVDFNRDGFPDITVANGESDPFEPCEGPYFLFQNDTNGNHWLTIELIGLSSNIHGLGARITVTTADGVGRIHDYMGGHHYLSQDLLPAHFGLGTHTAAATVEIAWPSGTVDTLTAVAADQALTVIEGQTSGLLMVVTPGLPTAMAGSAYSHFLQAAGGTLPYSWAIASGGLPDGLSLDPASGEISGTTFDTGVFPITVEVGDDLGDTATADLHLAVIPPPLQVTTTSLPEAVLGLPYSAFLQAAGGVPPYSWAITSGGLPAGLGLETTSGEISGAPAELGRFSITVQATDAVGGSAASDLTLDVIDVVSALTLYTSMLSPATETIFYRAQLQAHGGVPPYSWSVAEGVLPLGLTVDSQTGLVSGTPAEVGTFDITWQVSDSLVSSATRDLTLVVAGSGPVVVRTRGLPQGTYGVVYGASLHASGGYPPYSWAITAGALPAGIDMSVDGALSGTPTETGTFTLTVEATGSQGAAATRQLSLTVHADSGATTFTDVSSPAGLDGVFGCSLSSAWGDYNGDGLLDALIVSHVQPSSYGVNHLFRNNGDGTFTDVIDQTGDLAPFTEDPHGAAFGDVDDDGDQDLFLAHGLVFELNVNAKNEYLINDGDGTFTDLTWVAGMTPIPDPNDVGASTQLIDGATWIDVDADGDLDQFASGRRPDGARGSFLYINDSGDGTRFADAAVAYGLGGYDGDDSIATWNDYDHDGDVDVFKCLDSVLMQNNGDGTFTDVSSAAGIVPVRSCRGQTWGDYDNDGDGDLYVASADGESTLFQNQGDGTFVDVTATAGVGAAGETQGVMFGDYDNDQDLDLVAITGDARPNRLFRNDGGVFTEVGKPAGIGGTVGGKGSDGLWGDYDNDGFLDLLITNGGGSSSTCRYGPYLLFHNNRQSGNHWLKIELVGQQSNRDGIGTKVWVTTPDAVVQYTQYFGPQHMMSQDSRPIHFGLGPNTQVETIDLVWPSGMTDRLTDVAADQAITVTEGSTAVQLEVTGVVPNEVIVGTSAQLVVSGQGFMEGVSVAICHRPGRMVIDQIQFVDSTTLVIDVTVPASSAPGPCAVRAVNPGGESDVLPRAVTLTAGATGRP